jgi:hypothetical protein
MSAASTGPASASEPLTGDILNEDELSDPPAQDDIVLKLRAEIRDGNPWFPALLDAVGRWRPPEEMISSRTYRYLIHGEAFDWLLLAERLLDEVADLVPYEESVALLFRGTWPEGVDDDEFARRLGPAKHSAHLNFLYGVLVEEALQIRVEEEIHKENFSRALARDPINDETMFRRVYGKPRAELVADYYEESGIMLGGDLPHADWQAFTYWLFKARLKRQDKARVASDTRKGLAQLSRMELAVSQRRRGAALDEQEFAELFSG